MPILSLALLAIVAATVHAQPLPAAVDSLARAFVAETGAPSLVVGLSVGGVRATAGYGLVAGAAPTAVTPYEIGSVTKAVTALALADAVVRGDLALETHVQTLLPDSVRLAVTGRPITLADLATHSAGLPRMPVPFAPASMLDPYADYTEADLLAFVGAVVPDSAGEAYAYSNVGGGLLAWLLARRDGDTVEGTLRRRVLGPLGMDATGLSTPEALAPPTSATGAPLPPWTWTDALAGAGGLRSTAADLLTLAEAVSRPDRAPTLADALRLSLTPRFTAEGRFRVGLVWHLRPLDGGPVRLAWHNGATFGSSAFVGAAPQRDVALVLLANESVPGELDALAGEIMAALGAE